MAEIKDLLISEAHYKETMMQTVEPFLAARRSELWLEREPGKKIHCLCYKAEQPKAVIIISHGFTESGEKYGELIYYFLNMHYSVYLPEHCGHGYSYRMTDDFSLVHIDSFSSYIQDLLFVSERVKRDNLGLALYLFAHSMGGGIGAAAAAEAPKLYDKVILTSPMIRPITGNTPWPAAQAMTLVMCLLGKGKEYITGSRPYEGPEVFETSCSLSRARFDYYQEKRAKDQHLQTRSGSYRWLRGTAWLNRYLMKKAWKQIEAPVLLFQADQETVVSKEQQVLFLEKLKKNGKTTAAFESISNAKHEICNSTNPVLNTYLEKVFEFYG